MMGTFDDWQAQKDSQYILAVDYLEQLAKQHDSTIEATANYLIHCDSLKEIYEKSDNGEYYPAYEPTGYGYYDNDTPPPRIQFLESAKANTDTTGKILSKDFYRMWDIHYFKKSELPIIEPVAPSEPQAGKIKPLNSLASFVTSYNLPQVAALILGISFEYLTVNQNHAYISENDYPYEMAVKFDKLLSSLVTSAKSGHLQGVVIAYYEPFSFQNPYTPTLPTQPKKEFDYLNTVIDKTSLETYLKSIGKDLTQLLELQEPLTTTTPQTDSQLLQQVADLNAQLEQARAETERLKSHSNQYKNIGNGALFMFQDEAKKSEQQKATIDQQAKEIERLKAQLASIEQAGKDTQSDTPADRGQGDSLLILGAVMSTIEQVAKTNYTQASFIENHILPKYGHINGISESTLQKKFSQAKTYLKQKV